MNNKQILADFIVLTKTGLYCRYGNFYLDPQEPVADAVISHAHADHAVANNKNVFCTPATASFMQHRYKQFAAVNFYLKEYAQTFVLNEIEISFYAAGHMLGSALVLMTYKGVKYLYTGDYKLQPDPTCAPITFVQADVLITETTFANPTTEHPDAVQEITKLNAVTANIMLGSYALGKSQRLIAMLHTHCPTKRLLVHHSIVPFAKIYEKYGVNLGKYEVYDRKVIKNNSTDIIYIVPPMVYNSFFKTLNLIKIFATGWKNLQNKNQIQLYISDHVDWKAILKTIECVSPQEIWTTHGNGVALKQHFENKLVVKLLN